MNAMRQEACSLLAGVPESFLPNLLIYLRQLKSEESKQNEKVEAELWSMDSPQKEAVQYLWGLLEGTDPIDAKGIRKERLQKYESGL